MYKVYVVNRAGGYRDSHTYDKIVKYDHGRRVLTLIGDKITYLIPLYLVIEVKITKEEE
jgi:hypothetical protein